jgi:hypothetical protein
VDYADSKKQKRDDQTESINMGEKEEVSFLLLLLFSHFFGILVLVAAVDEKAKASCCFLSMFCV